jgi:papain like cysteine protease AvrRpt2
VSRVSKENRDRPGRELGEKSRMSQVSYTVPLVEQGPNPICWIACAAMILSWKRQTSVTIGSLIGADPSNSSIGDLANGDWPKLQSYLQSWGFFCQTLSSCPMVDFLQIRLAEHGPLLYIHSAAGFPYDARFPAYTSSPLIPPGAVHAIVLTGVDTDAGNFSFANPWGAYGVVPVNIVLEWLENFGILPGVFPLAYL